MDILKSENAKWVQIAATVLAVLLAIVFVGAGLYKIIDRGSAVEEFERFGYPPWFVTVTVLVELLAAALVAIPRTRHHGTTLIICIMVGAVISHLKAEEPWEAVSPLVVLGLAVFLSWATRPDSQDHEKKTEP